MYLPDPVFTHGQLYVGASRSNAPSGIKFLLGQSEGHGYQDGQSNEYSGPFTHNIVYRSVLKQTSSDNTPVDPAEVTSVTSLSAQQKAVSVVGAEVQDAGCDYIDLSMTQESTLLKALLHGDATSAEERGMDASDLLSSTDPFAIGFLEDCRQRALARGVGESEWYEISHRPLSDVLTFMAALETHDSGGASSSA